MKGFVYFVELDGRAGLVPGEGAELRAVLGDSLPAVQVRGGTGDGGRGTGDGVLVFRPGTDRVLVDRAVAGKLEWQEWGTVSTERGPARCLVGFARDAMPGAADLQREGIWEGSDVKLGDGGVWRLPRLLRRTREYALPVTLSLDAEGKAVARPMRRYEALARKGERVWDYVVDRLRAAGVDGGERATLSVAEAIGILTEALALQYHVGRVEVGLLELLTGGARGNVAVLLGNLVDVELYAILKEAEKVPKASASPVASSAS